MISYIKKLSKMACHLDNIGLLKEADYLDGVIRKIADGDPFARFDNPRLRCEEAIGKTWYVCPEGYTENYDADDAVACESDDEIMGGDPVPRESNPQWQGGPDGQDSRRCQALIGSIGDVSKQWSGRDRPESTNEIIMAILGEVGAEEALYGKLDKFPVSRRNMVNKSRSFSDPPAGGNSWAGALGASDAPGWVKVRFRTWTRSDVYMYRVPSVEYGTVEHLGIEGLTETWFERSYNVSNLNTALSKRLKRLQHAISGNCMRDDTLCEPGQS